jgi:hypothetical protein
MNDPELSDKKAIDQINDILEEGTPSFFQCLFNLEVYLSYFKDFSRLQIFNLIIFCSLLVPLFMRGDYDQSLIFIAFYLTYFLLMAVREYRMKYKVELLEMAIEQKEAEEKVNH